MSKLKRLASVLLALVMAFGMTCTAFATDTTYTITVDNTDDGYVYDVYQILTGTASGNTLSNVAWGSSLTTTIESALESEYNATGASGVANAIVSDGDAQALAKFLADYTSSMTAVGSLNSTTSSSLSVVSGYYLIVNTTVPAGNYAYSDYIVKVIGEAVEIESKAEIPSSDKTVDDINDSTETSVTTGESADHDIGDNVPFTLTATLPGDYAKYETYKLIFHDVMDTGLTFNSDSVVVTVTTNSTDYTVDKNGYTVATTAIDLLDSACTFEVQIADTKSLTQDGVDIPVNAGSTIAVDFTARLNENAVIGNPGNKNTMHIEYSNNPNNSGSGSTDTGETPPDTVVVFTYKLTVNKVDEDGDTPLKGAGFTLYKYDIDATTDNKYVQVGDEVKGDEMTTFTWTGLDDGKYKLKETTTPSGYNTMTDIEFYIVAVHDDTNGITSLKVTSDATGTQEISGWDVDFSAGSSSTVTTAITNNKGSSLPTTGGIGTTIFYVVGGVLVIGAVVLLITKKRMGE